jgi:hypothetical protein
MIRKIVLPCRGCDGARHGESVAKYFVSEILIVFLCCVISCRTYQVSSNYEAVNAILNTSKYTSDVYIGISGRMSVREKEFEYAKLHIANQIALRERCVVDEGMVFLHGARQNYDAIDSNFDYDDSYLADIMDRIEIFDTYIFPGFSVIIGRDTQRAGRENYFVNRSSGTVPEWVNRPPVIAGHYVGIGRAERYSLPYKGIVVADVNAAQQIATEINAFSNTFFRDTVREGAVTYSEHIRGDLVLVKAELYGFYILDRWIDPDSAFCYSLGIAEKL